MQKVIVAIVSLFLSMAIFSCAKKKEENKPEPKSATEIMETYTKTITTAPKRARAAGEAADTRHELEEKAIKEVDQ